MASVEVVDGSALEGGGQVVRASSALCAMGRRALRIDNIRGGRPKPGLAAQHLASLRLVAEASGASLKGAFKGSLGCELSYDEEQEIPASLTADSGTAGSTMLMLQAVLPVCVGRERVELTLRGGTNASHAPGVDHAHMVLAPILSAMGVRVDLRTVRRGFFPEGGGEVSVVVSCGKIAALDMGGATATPASVEGVVFGRGLSRQTAEALADRVKARLVRKLDLEDVQIRVDDVSQWSSSDDSSSKKRRRPARASCGMQLCLVTSGGGRVGADMLVENKAEPACVGDLERASDETVDRLVADASIVGNGTDEHTADQLVVFMALADGESRLRCPAAVGSRHHETVIHLATRFTGASFQQITEGPSQLIICTPAPKEE